MLSLYPTILVQISQQLLGVQEIFKMGDVGKLDEISTTLAQVCCQ